MKPLLNGNEVSRLFNAKGKEIKIYLDTIIDIQIMHKGIKKKYLLDKIKMKKVIR